MDDAMRTSTFGLESSQQVGAETPSRLDKMSSECNLIYLETNYNSTNSANIQDIPAKKVHVGDIDIAYKVFGKGDPIFLFNGASDGMNVWDPSLTKSLSSNHTVIVFDPRGIGNTTIGSKPYTYQQLANDTAGLMDALKIPKADVMGYSLGSYIAQQLTIQIKLTVLYLSVHHVAEKIIHLNHPNL